MPTAPRPSGRTRRVGTTTRSTRTASPTDAAILRIETAYTNRGQVDTVSSYNAASAGTMVNQVDYTYDAWGNVTKIEQDRDAAGTGTSPYDVDFTYDEDGAAGVTSAFLRIHRTGVTYPAGDLISFRYGNFAGTRGDAEYVAAALGRVDQVKLTPSGGSAIVEATYKYLGLGHVVRTDYPVPDMWSAVTAASSSYPGLDRFNRIVESSWTWDYATGTDYNAYELDLTYDRNSGITWAEDRWHEGRDVLYSLDGLNRLTGAQRGDRSGGSVNLENFHQEWTLDQTGNWDLFKNDLNGDGDWSDSDEVQDNRTHNVVNEITGRDTNNSSPDEFTPLYTAAGQLSDDDQHYKYTYDVWGRLVKITNQSNATVTEYEYNGLGHRIGHRWDKDADTDLDWQWMAYDDKWRVIARFEDGAAVSEPFEQVYHHHAGIAGYGGSSYIDLVIARDRDTNTGSAGFETREYVLQNWRADVVALTAPDGDLLERVTYDAYGIPFATHPTDLTTGNTGGVAGYGMPSGVLDANDYNYFLTLYGNTDFRADWNRDGVFDTGDSFAYLADYTAATGSWGRGVLSNRSNILGYAGYIHEPATGSAGGGQATMWHVRRRVINAGLGSWTRRDPIHYSDGYNLMAFNHHNPVFRVDPSGLLSFVPVDHYVRLIGGCNPDGVIAYASWYYVPTSLASYGCLQGESGWIVQEIQSSDELFECDTGQPTYVDAHFLEAWRVTPLGTLAQAWHQSTCGKPRLPTLTNYMGNFFAQDESVTVVLGPSTSGISQDIGLARVVCDSQIAGFPDPLNPMFWGTQVRNSGCLPSRSINPTTPAPGWWQPGLLTGTSRQHKVTWDLCGALSWDAQVGSIMAPSLGSVYACQRMEPRYPGCPCCPGCNGPGCSVGP